jgi:hypothetical protein
MKYSAVLLLAFLLGGCSRGLDRADLPGVYVFDGSGLRQQITLNMNGEYLNALYADGALSWTETGKWIYEQQGSKSGVTFSNFRFGLKDTSDRPGLWFVVPEKTIAGQKQLCFDIDLNRCFRAL